MALDATEIARRTAHRRKCRSLFPLKHAICQGCFYMGAQERHHQDGSTHNNSPANVLLLCVACHHRLHTGERWHADRDQA